MSCHRQRQYPGCPPSHLGVGSPSDAAGTTPASISSSVMVSGIAPAKAHIPLTPSSAVMAFKLQQGIVKLDFVAMRELLPETWQQEEENAGPITDILQWVQCFAALAGVLARTYPTIHDGAGVYGISGHNR